MAVEFLIVGILPALLVAAAVWDLTSYTIPNLIILGLLAAFVAFLAVATPGGAIGWHDASLHLLAGLAGFLAGLALFATGLVGGGDAKLFAAAALWLGWNMLLEFTIVAALLGGLLTIALVLLRRFGLPSFLARQAWLSRLADSKAGIPYGVALSGAALVLLPHTELFRIAAAA